MHSLYYVFSRQQSPETSSTWVYSHQSQSFNDCVHYAPNNKIPNTTGSPTSTAHRPAIVRAHPPQNHPETPEHPLHLSQYILMMESKTET